MIYTEDQKKVRDQCARSCFVAMENPNAIIPEKFRSWADGYIKDCEPVRAWMLFISMVEVANKRKEQQNLKEEGLDKETLKQRAYLAKMVEISEPGNKHEYWKKATPKPGNPYHTSNR